MCVCMYMYICMYIKRTGLWYYCPVQQNNKLIWTIPHKYYFIPTFSEHKNITCKKGTRPAFCGCMNCAFTSFAICAASLLFTSDINLVR